MGCNETPLAQPPPKGFKQEPRISGVFCLHPHCWVIFYKFKKTTRNEKWEKVKILKKQLKKHLLKLKKKKKQKRDLKKLIDNYAQGNGSGGSINELILHKKK